MRSLLSIATAVVFALYVAAPIALERLSEPRNVTILLTDVSGEEFYALADAVEGELQSLTSSPCGSCKIGRFYGARSGTNAMLVVPMSQFGLEGVATTQKVVGKHCAVVRICGKVRSISATGEQAGQSSTFVAYLALILLGLLAAIVILVHWRKHVRLQADWTGGYRRWIAAPIVGVIAFSAAFVLNGVFSSTYTPAPLKWPDPNQLLMPILVIPLVEEFFFRAWMLRTARINWRSLPVISVSMIGFVISHFNWAGEFADSAIGVVQLLILSSATTWLWLRRRSLADCFLAHAVFNALAIAFRM